MDDGLGIDQRVLNLISKVLKDAAEHANSVHVDPKAELYLINDIALLVKLLGFKLPLVRAHG